MLKEQGDAVADGMGRPDFLRFGRVLYRCLSVGMFFFSRQWAGGYDMTPKPSETSSSLIMAAATVGPSVGVHARFPPDSARNPACLWPSRW